MIWAARPRRGGMEGGRGIGGVEAERNEMPAVVNLGLNGNAPTPFLSKTYDMVDDPATDEIVSWGSGSNSFVVWNPPEFTRDLLPKYFRHTNFSSFVRQLNTYGFRKVDPDRWEFANEGFLRGQKNLLKSINRRKPSRAQGHSELEQPTSQNPSVAQGHSELEQPTSQNPSVTSCVEVGKFFFKEEIERLKRDKNVLMQELVKLRQQQQTADRQLDTLVKRLQVMEQRQQQMMSFLVKAMRSTGFLKQLVQQNDSNIRIAGVGKKRRLPKRRGNPDGEMLEGQIVKYQPLINAAAKAVLRQILKMNGSPTLESMGNSDNLLLENFRSPYETFQSTSSRNSQATRSDVPSNSDVSFVDASSGFSAVYATASGESDQSSVLDTNMIGADEVTELGVFPSAPGEIALSPADIDIPELLGIVPEDDVVDIPVENLEVPESHNLHVNPNASTLEEVVPIETDDFSADTVVNFYDTEERLPGIIDLFCEQYLVASPVYFDIEEVESTPQEFQHISDDTLDNIHPMNHITEQMGLLSSDPNP